MELKDTYNWESHQYLDSKQYICGFCGNSLASQRGFRGISTQPFEAKGYKTVFIYICHFCSRPTYFDYDGEQIPGRSYGNDIENIDEQSVKELYNEARRAMAGNCFTAAVLCCRKLLMHISVAKGAEQDKSFAYYVSYLSDNHFVPPGAHIWVNHIRGKGNEANHEISIMNLGEAQELVEFCEMLLKIIYEFPGKVKKRYPSIEDETLKNAEC